MQIYAARSERAAGVVIVYSNQRQRSLTPSQALAIATALDELSLRIDQIEEIPDDLVISGTARELVGDIADALRRAAKEVAT